MLANGDAAMLSAVTMSGTGAALCLSGAGAATRSGSGTMYWASLAGCWRVVLLLISAVTIIGAGTALRLSGDSEWC